MIIFRQYYKKFFKSLHPSPKETLMKLRNSLKFGVKLSLIPHIEITEIFPATLSMRGQK